MKFYAKIKRHRDSDASPIIDIDSYRKAETDLIAAFFRDFNPKSSIRADEKIIEIEIEFDNAPPMCIMEAISLCDLIRYEYAGEMHPLSKMEPEGIAVESCDNIASGIHKARRLKAESETEKSAILTMAEKLKPLRGKKIATFGARPQDNPQNKAHKGYNESDSSDFIHIPELDDIVRVSRDCDEFISNVSMWLKISDKDGKRLRFIDVIKSMLRIKRKLTDLVNTKDRQHYMYKITVAMKSIGHEEITPLKFINIVCKYASIVENKEASLQNDEQKRAQDGDPNSKQYNVMNNDPDFMHTHLQMQTEHKDVQDDDLKSKQDNAQNDDPNLMHSYLQNTAEQDNVQENNKNAEQNNVHSNDQEARQDNAKNNESDANNFKSIKCFEKAEDFTKSINAIDPSMSIDEKVVRILELMDINGEKYTLFLRNIGYEDKGIEEVRNRIKNQTVTAITIDNDEDFESYLEEEMPEDDILVRLDFASFISEFVHKNGLDEEVKVKTFLRDIRHFFNN